MGSRIGSEVTSHSSGLPQASTHFVRAGILISESEAVNDMVSRVWCTHRKIEQSTCLGLGLVLHVNVRQRHIPEIWG